MPPSELTIRSFTWADLEVRARLMRAIDGDESEPLSRAVERTRRAALLPGTQPERDVFLAGRDETLVGHVEVIVEQRIGRGVFVAAVHPAHRRRGVGRALVRQAIEHASSLCLAVLQTDQPESNTSAIEFCVSEGFRHVRTHLHMEIASPKTVEATVPEGLALRGLVRSDVPALTELQNAAFEGSWGYQPNVPEEIAYRIYEQPLDQPDDVIVLANRDGTLAAYCWCEHGAPGEPGAVGMVGVSPSRQGQGLGRSVTAAGVDLLVAAGARPVEITVDEANEPGVRLYRRLGFEVVSRSVWYERALNE